MFNITKFQRHPTNDDAVILHLTTPQGEKEIVVDNAEYRSALENADKLED